MERHLEGKVAIITGSGRGIGRATAFRMAKEGAAVVVNDIDEVVASEVAGGIREQGGRAVFIVESVADRTGAKRIIERAIEEFGRINILVNNAGYILSASLIDMSEEQFDQMIATHLKGTFNCTQFAIAHMIPQRRGKIINLTSYAALKGLANAVDYSAAKAGIIGFTMACAKELARYNINVNVIAPVARAGVTQTWQEKDDMEAILRQIPLGRLGEPEEIAHAMVFLASDGADYITGQVLRVDGGMAI